MLARASGWLEGERKVEERGTHGTLALPPLAYTDSKDIAGNLVRARGSRCVKGFGEGDAITASVATSGRAAHPVPGKRVPDCVRSP